MAFIFVVSDPFSLYLDNSGIIQKENEWTLETDGMNLQEVLNADNVTELHETVKTLMKAASFGEIDDYRSVAENNLL
ncbi:9344_t:CDS:2, partial [Funneliformis mosseae]